MFLKVVMIIEQGSMFSFVLIKDFSGYEDFRLDNYTKNKRNLNHVFFFFLSSILNLITKN